MATSEQKVRHVIIEQRNRHGSVDHEAGESETELCPLCWRQVPFGELRVEHAIPQSVGGNSLTVTCRTCNNDHGSRLDSQLTAYRRHLRSLEGLEPIDASVSLGGYRVTAGVTLGSGEGLSVRKGINIQIVGKASDPAAVRAIQEAAKAGQIRELALRLRFGFVPDRYQLGLLRAGYLLLYRRWGPEYAQRDDVQAIRKRIQEPESSFPDVSTLVGQIKGADFEKWPPGDHYIATGKFDNRVGFLMVLVRMRLKTERDDGKHSWHFVFMPSPVEQSTEFFALAASAKEEGRKMSIPWTAVLHQV